MPTETALRISAQADLDDTKMCYWKDQDLDCWFLYIPRCGAGRLSNHTVEEHEDGTITVNPSILMYGHSGGNPMQRHGYLTRGVWNES